MPFFYFFDSANKEKQEEKRFLEEFEPNIREIGSDFSYSSSDLLDLLHHRY